MTRRYPNAPPEPSPVEVNESHKRLRVELRRPSDGGVPPMPPAAAVEPFQDPKTGRIVDGKRAALASARRRRLLALEREAGAIATLNPDRCESWLSPHVRDGAAYVRELAERFPDPALARLVGETADAHAMTRGLLALAAQGAPKALGEARAWMREHRACLRELCALAGLVGKKENADPHAAVMTAFGEPIADAKGATS